MASEAGVVGSAGVVVCAGGALPSALTAGLERRAPCTPEGRPWQAARGATPLRGWCARASRPTSFVNSFQRLLRRNLTLE